MFKLDLEKAEKPEIKLPTPFGIVNRAEVDAFMELFHFFDYLMDVGNLIFVPLPFLNSA